MLQKRYRLRKDSDLRRIHRKARVYFSRGANLKILANNRGYSRFALVVSKKVSPKSTARNKIKRQASEILRKNIGNIKPELDFLFMIKKPMVEADYQEKLNNIVQLLKKTKTWKK